MATFTHDTFTDTNGTLVNDHVGETGATWTQTLGNAPDATPPGGFEVASNRVWGRRATNYAASGIPATADYHVVGDLYTAALDGGPIGQLGIHVRATSVAPSTCYAFTARHGVTPNQWSIDRFVNGTGIKLTFAEVTLVADTHYEMAFQIVGNTMTAFVDDTQVLQWQDSTIAAAGFAGFHTGQANTAAAGLLLDEITAADGPFTASALPTITSITPANGPAGGGTDVTIAGINFTDTTEVNFGSEPADSFVEESDTEITAVSPAGTEGNAVNILITTTAGISAATSEGQFTYDTPTSLWAPSNIKIRTS